MKPVKILQLLSSGQPLRGVVAGGWVKTRRTSKSVCFLEVNDGSCLENLQVVATPETTAGFDAIKDILTGTSVIVTGDLVPSPGKGQKWELSATRVDMLGSADTTYPLQKKRHSDEFLRTIAHLRPKTNKYGAMFRIRSEASFAVHRFFKERGFFHIHMPILTTLDCEGAGELFLVSEASKKDGRDSLFDKRLYLTVSGQLAAEMLALCLGDVYTFGPVFRAENSNTPRHAAEFWMVEPEMAFCDLERNMDVAEEFVKNLVSYLLETCEQDLSLFFRFVDPALFNRLENLCNLDFERITYGQAIDILNKADVSFKYPTVYGSDLQTEHERYLTETYFKKGVFVYDYPREIKPFYMRVNDDGRTVAAMDLLLPEIGELIGGSQREERLDLLEEQMDLAGISKDLYGWYLDSRRYGSVFHSGFGMGFERFLMLATGVKNIRDVIPFPRTPGTVYF